MTPAPISRRDAQARGLKRYYTGEACSRGHVAERYVANGACVDCLTFQTPAKQRGPKASNVGWPPRAIIFNVPFQPTPEEIAAAFLYAESERWLDRALYDVHNDAALLAKHAQPISDKDAVRATVELERRRAFIERINADPAALAVHAEQAAKRCRYCGSDGGGPAYLDLHEQVCPQRPKV